MAAVEKVSFTIRRPTPISRAPSSGVESDGNFKAPSLPQRLANPNNSTPGRSTGSSPAPPAPNRTQEDSDSSDADEGGSRDELVTGFDRFGVQRCVVFLIYCSQSFSSQKSLVIHSKCSLHQENRQRSTTPLVIPALKNRDWRELARKRRSATQYVPASAKASTGHDGSVGGLGVRDQINSGPVLSGLQFKRDPVGPPGEQEGLKQEDMETDVHSVKAGDEDEDKRALRAILAGVNGVTQDGPMVDVIPMSISEADAYKQDVEELPNAATLDDYERVPVSQFGAALLRGMGWKEGTAATRQPGKGLVEPYLPAARPALLGIGAKEKDLFDDGSKKNSMANKRPDKRYVPVVRMERDDRPASRTSRRERSGSPRSRNGSTAVSRRNSRSRERGSDYDDRRRGTTSRSERDNRYDRDRSQHDDSRERRRDRSRDSRRRRD